MLLTEPCLHVWPPWSWSRRMKPSSLGDMVYLKLQPYVQTSVAARASHKLSYKYFGPFEILQKIGQVAYKLKLLESATVHHVFHVLQLRLSPCPNCPVSSSLPDQPAIQYPVEVLQHRTVSRGDRSVDDTWEDEMALHQPQPSHQKEDGGNDVDQTATEMGRRKRRPSGRYPASIWSA